MAIPPNTTPETAIAIGPLQLPFSQTVSAADLNDTPTGTGYASTCDSTQYKALWWVLTTGPAQTLFVISGGVGGSNSPRVSIWTGPLGGLTQYTTTGQDYCDNLGGTPALWLQVTVQPSTRYYIQVTDAFLSVADAPLQLSIAAGPQLAAPPGSLMIPNDDTGFPSLVCAAADGTPVRCTDTPACEFADTLPTGEWAFQSTQASPRHLIIYNSTLTAVVADVTFSTNIRAVKSDRQAFFYVVLDDVGTCSVQKVNAAGVVQPSSWTLPVDSDTADTFALAQGGGILYYASKTSGAPIHAYDLVNDTALPDLHAGFAGEFPLRASDGIGLSDGSVLLGFGSDALGATPKVRRISAAGVVLATYTLTDADLKTYDHICYADEYSFWVRGFPSGSQAVSYMRLVTISAGTVYRQWARETIGQGGGPAPTAFPFSATCPLIQVPYADTGSLTTPGSGGTGLSAPDVAPTPPNNGVIEPDAIVYEPIVWERIAPILVDNEAHHQIRWVRFELICQTGQGTLDFQVCWSDDSGYTWSAWQTLALGAIGAYAYRGYLWNMGVSRQRIYRLRTAANLPVNVQSVLITAVTGRS